MLVREFQRIVDAVLPPESAMHGDAIGLQVASKRSDVGRVLVCLEITDAIVAEAIERSCDTILTFHPLIYTPLARLDRSDRVSRCVGDLIVADISVICVHTTFDAFPQGTNLILAERLGLEPLRPIVPSMDRSTGMGLLASCSMTYSELIERIAVVCGGPVRHCPPLSESVRAVAIVGGSGVSFYDAAVSSGADVFITADVKYHAFHAASGVIGLVDPGHFEMEQFVPAGLVSVLSTAAPSLTFLESTVVTNPVHYAYRSSQRSINLSSHP